MSPGSRPIHGTFPRKLPASHRAAPRITMTTPTPRRILPRPVMRPPPESAARSERKLALPGGGRGASDAEMRVGGGGGPAPGGRAHEETDLQEERLDHLDERLRLVIDGGGDRLQPGRAAAVLLDERGQEAAIQTVQARFVH